MVRGRVRATLVSQRSAVWLRPMIVCSGLCVVACFAATFAEAHAGQAALLAEYRERVKVMAELGARFLARASAYELWRQSSADLPENKVSEIENSIAFREVWGQLHGIQQIDRDLIRFVYLIRSFDRGEPRFLADADVLRLDRPAQVSHFNKTYPLDAVSHLREALQTCELQWEQDFVVDDEYGVSSLSAYAPIHLDGMPAGSCIVLGVDMVDTDARNMQAGSGIRGWRSALLLTALLLATSNAVVLLLTRAWANASQRVRRLAQSYCGLDAIAEQPRMQQLNMDLDALERFCNARGDDMVKHHATSIFASSPTAERLRNDVVPDLVIGRSAQSSDAIAWHDHAIVLVATLDGLGRRESGQTDMALTAWHRVFDEYTRLARDHGVWHASTTGSSFIAVAAASQPGAPAAILALARTMISATNRNSDPARFPLFATIGIDAGPVALRGDHETKRLSDLWGGVPIDAKRLLQQSPTHGIYFSARVSALFDVAELRRCLDRANG